MLVDECTITVAASLPLKHQLLLVTAPATSLFESTKPVKPGTRSGTAPPASIITIRMGLSSTVSPVRSTMWTRCCTTITRGRQSDRI